MHQFHLGIAQLLKFMIPFSADQMDESQRGSEPGESCAIVTSLDCGGMKKKKTCQRAQVLAVVSGRHELISSKC